MNKKNQHPEKALPWLLSFSFTAELTSRPSEASPSPDSSYPRQRRAGVPQSTPSAAPLRGLPGARPGRGLCRERPMGAKAAGGAAQGGAGRGCARALGPPPPLPNLSSSSRAAAGNGCCCAWGVGGAGQPPPGKCLTSRLGPRWPLRACSGSPLFRPALHCPPVSRSTGAELPAPARRRCPPWSAAVPESPGAGGPTQGPPLLSGSFAGPGSVGREVPAWALLLGLQLPAAGPVLQESRLPAFITRWRRG